MMQTSAARSTHASPTTTAAIVPALPPRPGPVPRLDEQGPLWQRDQRAAPALWVAVWDALRGIPGVIIGPSAMAEPDARAVLVPPVTNPVDGTSFAPRGTPLEPAHLHGPRDTSLHLVLPRDRGAEVIDRGWGVPCPYARFGTELILFAARDDEELAVVASLAREGVLWALRENAVTTFRPSVLATRFAI
ncbi:hypothetical protein OVN20_07425 [Microcella daejeonensis]|uniref:luciferase domain-containing protein n=1 Tax=Microcella daejeonensis TaxID=2994971 RepID=UPI00226FB744|nr:hypothetical protein [Microcella daejeonensis]WAB82945.1 hypothetical protein OVN20_07425 [Microcella daejeonensis]